MDSPINTLVWEFSVSSNILVYDFNQMNQQLSLFSTSSPGMVNMYIEVTDDSLLSCTDSIIINVISDITAITNTELTGLPDKYSLYHNYPNPFNPSTKIKFALPKSDKVKVEIFNTLGKKIKTLLNESLPAGYHEVEFNGHNLSSGIYLVRIVSSTWQDVQKMVLLK